MSRKYTVSSNPGETAPEPKSAAPRSSGVGVAALTPAGPMLPLIKAICFDFPLYDPGDGFCAATTSGLLLWSGCRREAGRSRVPTPVFSVC